MNFGPLNRAGGERRLNVALTRAREEMLVFSTLKPEHIDVRRTDARAIRDLKQFLQYAARGPEVLGTEKSIERKDHESPFEEAVARALEDRGWVVVPQVGVSRYRIDLGIVHPDLPGAYLAGVECDGANYHSSAFARERDRIRQRVLEGLGWTIFRVWSTDWWYDARAAAEKLDRELREHLERDRNKRAREQESWVEQQEDPAAMAAEDSSHKPSAVETPTLEPAYVVYAQKVEAHAEATREAVRPEHVYAEAELSSSEFPAAPDRFYEDSYTASLVAMIERVIDIEGPVHEEVLARRIARHHGFKRTGRRIRERVLRLAKRRRHHHNESVGTFFWSQSQAPDYRAPARYLGRGEDMRDIAYICEDELRAIDEVLGLGGDVSSIARALGIERLRQSTRERLEAVFANNSS